MKPRGETLNKTSFSFRDMFLKVRQFFSNLSMSVKTKFAFRRKAQEPKLTIMNNKPKRDLRKLIPYTIFAVSVLIVLALLSAVTYKVFKNVSVSGKVSVLKPKATQEINKEFSFPLFGKDGKEVTRFKYVVEKAELRDEIIVNGKRARSVSGRTFLVVNIKISNDYKLPMQINSKDYIRLIVDGKNDQAFAADAHSDPVDVQPISTEEVTLGFAINDVDQSLLLKVGEINGEKQEISLSFK